MYTRESDTLHSNAYETIRKAIIMGDFAFGERLNEIELAQRLGFSRTPIREALKRLAGEGLVVASGRGLAIPQYTESDVRQIYDLRALLEGHAAGLAAQRRSDWDLHQLRKLHSEFEVLARTQEAKDGNEWLRQITQLNTAIHESIVRASQNLHLHTIVSRVVVLPLVFRSFFYFDAAGMRSSASTHATIVEAIANSDAERARSAMTEHIFGGRDHVIRHMEDRVENH